MRLSITKWCGGLWLSISFNSVNTALTQPFTDSSLIVFFILMYFFELDNWFILINSLFILPQIVHNALRGNNPKFISAYIFGVLASNILYPVTLPSWTQSSTSEDAQPTSEDLNLPSSSAFHGWPYSSSRSSSSLFNISLDPDHSSPKVYYPSSTTTFKAWL